jgi:hypothetical protein
MIRTRLILLGLCAALFGVMAFGASGAQAAKWLILMSNGEVLTGEQLPATVGISLESNAILHTEVLKVKFLVTCTSAELLGASLEGEGKVTSGGRVRFKGCIGETNGSVNANCTPKANGEPEGTILTNEGKGQLVLHEGTVGLTKIEPKTAGGAFATLEMKPPCPVGEKLPINGVLYLKDCENMLELHLGNHLIEEGPLTEMWATSNNNTEHKAHILGSALAFLTGAHLNLAWGGMPE